MRSVLYSLSVAAALLVAASCNPSDPFCDPATPCIGDDEVCNFALRRCEQKPDAAVEAGAADSTVDSAPLDGGADAVGEAGGG